MDITHRHVGQLAYLQLVMWGFNQTPPQNKEE
jgi:hypothetical protein